MYRYRKSLRKEELTADNDKSERWKAINISMDLCQTVVVSRKEGHVDEGREGKVRRGKNVVDL